MVISVDMIAGSINHLGYAVRRPCKGSDLQDEFETGIVV
jgi:hypothetical protein